MKRFPIPALALAALVAVYGAVPADADTIYTFTTLDDPAATVGYYPNGAGTEAYAIYGNTVVGTGWGTNGVSGFSETGGVFTTLQDPTEFGYNITYATGIWGSTIVGFFFDPGIDVYSYTLTGGVYKTLAVPGAPQTYAEGIFDDTVVGNFNNGPGTIAQGFTETDGVYTTINDPNGAGGTDVQGIYGNTLVGIYIDGAGNYHGFSETGGVYTTIDDPNATGGTEVMAIYGNTLVGNYVDGTGDHGFIETGGNYTSFDVPGTTITQIFGISSDGTLVGTDEDGVGNHGFIATPLSSSPEPASLSLLVFGGVVLLVRRRKPA